MRKTGVRRFSLISKLIREMYPNKDKKQKRLHVKLCLIEYEQAMYLLKQVFNP